VSLFEANNSLRTMELPGSDSEEQTARSGSGLLCGIEDETREGEGWEFVEYCEVSGAKAEGSSESEFQAQTVQSTAGSEERAKSNVGFGDLPKETSASETMDDGEGMVPDHNVDEQQHGRTASVLGGLGMAHLTLVARASWRNAWANIYRLINVIRNNIVDSGLRQLVSGVVSRLHSSWSLARDSMVLFQSRQFCQRCATSVSRLGVLNASLIIGCTGLCAVLYRSHKRNIFLQTKLEQQDAMLVQTMSRLFLLQRNSFKVPTIPYRVYERHVMHSAALRVF
jgi:hypothetical protein